MTRIRPVSMLLLPLVCVVVRSAKVFNALFKVCSDGNNVITGGSSSEIPSWKTSRGRGVKCPELIVSLGRQRASERARRRTTGGERWSIANLSAVRRCATPRQISRAGESRLRRPLTPRRRRLTVQHAHVCCTVLPPRGVRSIYGRRQEHLIHQLA